MVDKEINKVKPAILSLGTALPFYSLSQLEIAEQMNSHLHLDDEEGWYLEKIYKNSAIGHRYSVLPDIIDTIKNHKTFGMSQRNAIYRKEAPILAEKSVKEALKNWNRPVNEITHVISVSCTGVMTPGIEFLLAKNLGLDPHVSLLAINFMGCHGAFKALKVATKIAKEDPDNRILLVCTELCTLHFKSRSDIESIVIQSLFADGSAAAIIGCQKGLFDMIHEKSFAIQDSLNDMTWNASDEGFDMTLSQRVPELIGGHIEPFVKQLVRQNIELKECEWAIHPGGKLIVETVEKALNLNRKATTSTWNVLNHCGNISSATFLFVLKDMIDRKISNKDIIGLGFGPGLSVEGLLLRN